MGLAVRVDVTMLGDDVQVGAVVREGSGVRLMVGVQVAARGMKVLVGVTVWKRVRQILRGERVVRTFGIDEDGDEEHIHQATADEQQHGQHIPKGGIPAPAPGLE